jgi:hypothetical protein
MRGSSWIEAGAIWIDDRIGSSVSREDGLHAFNPLTGIGHFSERINQLTGADVLQHRIEEFSLEW